MAVTVCLNGQEYWQAASGVGAGVKQLPMGQADFKEKLPH